MVSMVWKSLICRNWIHQLRCWSQSGKHYVHSWTRILWALRYYLNYTIHINMLNRRRQCGLLTAHWTFHPEDFDYWQQNVHVSIQMTEDTEYYYWCIRNSVTHLYLCPSCNSAFQYWEIHLLRIREKKIFRDSCSGSSLYCKIIGWHSCWHKKIVTCRHQICSWDYLFPWARCEMKLLIITLRRSWHTARPHLHCKCAIT